MTINQIGYAGDEYQQRAQLLADKLHFVLNKDAVQCLFVGDRLALKTSGFSLLLADFSLSTWSKRRTEGKKQGVVRACKPAAGIRIIDVTAGWGRDAAVLASFGAEVLMLERHPVMGCLLADALIHQSETDKQHMKLALEAVDSKAYLAQLAVENYPDVIYIDPMHPERSKSALVKKDMQALQQMVGVDDDALELIELAIRRVKQRVVVKWPQRAPSLLKADACIEGKTVRFDIYIPKAN